MAVIADELHAGGGQERPGAGAHLPVEDRAARFDLFVQPTGPGVAVVATRALGHELAHLGDETQRRIGVLDGVELLFQFMGREPQTGVASGLVIGHHAVVDEAGYSHAALGVALLTAGKLQLDDHGGGTPALGTGTGLPALLALQLTH